MLRIIKLHKWLCHAQNYPASEVVMSCSELSSFIGGYVMLRIIKLHKWLCHAQNYQAS